MKKIAFVSTNDGHKWGGSEELWSLTALHLLDNGCGVAVGIKKWPEDPPRITDIKNKGGKIYFKNSNINLYDRLRSKIRPTQTKLKLKEKEKNWLDEYGPSLVVISLGHSMQGLDWMTACSKRNIPYVILVQLSMEHKWPGDHESKALKNGYEAAKKVCFVSKRNQDITKFQLNSDLENAVVIRNSFKVSWENQLDWPDSNTFKLASVAALSTFHKGQDLLFQVLRKEKWKQRPLTLTLVGDGPHAENLKYHAEKWDLKNVEFHGFSNDIEEIWKNHHGLLMGSRVEGLPLALVEAMLCKRVPIVPDVAGNNELVIDNVNGFLAKAPTVELIDEALERAWEQRSDWQDIGKKASEKVRATIPEKPVEVFADQLLELI